MSLYVSCCLLAVTIVLGMKSFNAVLDVIYGVYQMSWTRLLFSFFALFISISFGLAVIFSYFQSKTASPTQYDGSSYRYLNRHYLLPDKIRYREEGESIADILSPGSTSIIESKK